MLVVTLKPVGREEYALSLDGTPVYSSAVFGGYEQAQIPCQLDDEQRLYARGGTLRIHGKSGIVWQGIVTRRPSLTEPLLALGWGWSATLGRRAKLYCDTGLTEWSERTKDTRNTDLGVSTEAAQLRILLEAGNTYTGYNGFWRIVPLITSGKLTFSWARGSLGERIHVWQGTFSESETDGDETSSYTETEIAAYDTGAYSGTATVTLTNATAIGIGINVDDYTVGTSNTVRFSNVKVYGQATTSLTTSWLVGDVLDNEIDTDYLPAGAEYRAWIESQATTIEPLVFDSCDAATKLAEIAKYAPNDYGWYMEQVLGAPACVPHWTARQTTPSYIVRLAEAEVDDMDECAFSDIVSAVRVSYQTADGRSVYKDVTDTDTTHPLVQQGIVRYGDLPVQTSSAATAEDLGELYVAENGREQVKGSIVTRVVRTSTGAEAYLPDVRPGSMVRVEGLPDGDRDTIIKRATMSDDDVITLELDNDPYRLDILLARLAKRGAL